MQIQEGSPESMGLNLGEYYFYRVELKFSNPSGGGIPTEVSDVFPCPPAAHST